VTHTTYFYFTNTILTWPISISASRNTKQLSSNFVALFGPTCKG